jgi:hypothetical protein
MVFLAIIPAFQFVLPTTLEILSRNNAFKMSVIVRDVLPYTMQIQLHNCVCKFVPWYLTSTHNPFPKHAKRLVFRPTSQITQQWNVLQDVHRILLTLLIHRLKHVSSCVLMALSLIILLELASAIVQTELMLKIVHEDVWLLVPIDLCLSVILKPGNA